MSRYADLYTPRLGYGEDADIPPDYYELFGTSHVKHRLQGLNLYYSLTGDDYSNEKDYIREYLDENVVDVSSAFSESQINAIRETPVPYSQKEDPQGKQWTYYYDLFNEGLRNADASSLVTQATGTEYVQPTSFADAQLKGYNAWADTIKKERLNHEQGSEEWNELTDILTKGPMDFTGPNDVSILTFNSPKAVQEGYRAQANVMKDYLQSAGIDMYKEVDDPDKLVHKDRVWLVTGTALPWFEDSSGRISTQTNWASQDIGSYGMWEDEQRPETTAESLAEGIGWMMDFISLYPPAAPVAQTLKNYAYTEDWGEAVEAGVKTYTATELANIGNAEVSEILTDAGIDISALPAPAQEMVLDTTTAVIQGESGTEAAKKAATGEALGAVGEMLPDVDLPDINLPDFETPQIVKDVGDVVVDVLEPPLEFVGETFEPVVDTTKQVLSTAEDVLEPVKEVVETVGEPIVDAVDEVIDAVDSPLGDLLEGILGSISGIGGTGGMMTSTRQQPTQVEGLFDKELFKFDTEIKSTQEILSPMMNKKRRYG